MRLVTRARSAGIRCSSNVLSHATILVSTVSTSVPSRSKIHASGRTSLITVEVSDYGCSPRRERALDPAQIVAPFVTRKARPWTTHVGMAVLDSPTRAIDAARRPPIFGIGGEKGVETHGLTKSYGAGILAVDKLDLNVYRGEVYGFLGPNGAGKTTTLRMLLGLIGPTAGSARVMGAIPGTPASLVKVGAIVETPAFYPYMSGYDNLRLLATYCGVARGRVDATLAEVDLTPRAHHKFSTYSLGMKQRLGIAAALLKEPELLILDEPTNGLDPQGMADVRNLIIELGKGERTVLISSHLLGEVELMCTRVGVI